MEPRFSIRIIRNAYWANSHPGKRCIFKRDNKSPGNSAASLPFPSTIMFVNAESSATDRAPSSVQPVVFTTSPEPALFTYVESERNHHVFLSTLTV